VEYEDIRLSRDGAVATIAVHRPRCLNAIRFRTMLEIQDALDDIAADDAVRAVVLTGSGEKAFIAGGDISIMAEMESPAVLFRELPRGQQICSNIENFPKPVIARINGIALGGGTELACCCDIRIAADTAILGVPEIGLGIIPGYGGTQRLPRLVGMGKAKKLVLTGDPIGAREALEIGLVDEVVPKAELDAAVERLCRKIASRSPLALAMGKEAINMGMQADIRTGMSIEARCFLTCFGSEDRMEGMRAFLEKRTPRFKGR
jgi:enoyl-CoA hydratase